MCTIHLFGLSLLTSSIARASISLLPTRKTSHHFHMKGARERPLSLSPYLTSSDYCVERTTNDNGTRKWNSKTSTMHIVSLLIWKSAKSENVANILHNWKSARTATVTFKRRIADGGSWMLKAELLGWAKRLNQTIEHITADHNKIAKIKRSHITTTATATTEIQHENMSKIKEKTDRAEREKEN